MTRLCLGPSPLDLCVYAGDSNKVAVEILAADVPVYLVGAEITAQARLTRVDPHIAISADIEPIDLENGRFTMAWDGEQVRLLLDDAGAWRGVWDLQVRYSNNLVDTYLAGSFVATSDVTRLP